MQVITEKQRNTRRNILMNLLSELGFKSIKAFQKSEKLAQDGLFGIVSYNALYKKLLNVVELQNFEGHYFKQVYPKNQIVWHHSAGWDNARGMYDWWRNDGVFHVATAVGITDDGTIFRGFEESYWAHHIGMKHLNNLARNQQSIAVEICNWGNLTEKNGKLYSWANVEIPKNKTIELNYKGYKFYEVYTDKEIESLKYWTLLNAMRFGIPLAYRENEMWQVSQKAIDGVAGIYTHNSFLSWKTDVSPQPKLIAMAKSLADYEKR
ncbi:MAG: N-acetylmuramoyl-L-alanine amidase [Raineya sp.]|nr:N-acetylmuramoyl-L-alanine amidase [Raineya sp.]MDW8295776.1 N-acetylmuramoyl-L-alanine amidase [Raineya sp.]